LEGRPDDARGCVPARFEEKVTDAVDALRLLVN
jgi:hypothetical protein